jgi:hypothetical protein
LSAPAIDLAFDRVGDLIADMEIWSAMSDGFSFVISYESRTGPGFRGQNGYVASWRSTARVNMGSVRIAGSPFTTLEQAEDACRSTLDYLIGRRN